MSMEVRDPIYCFEIARRSVGRAALHLGVDSMTEASLDVLADVLLQYMHRVGRTLSHLVEASGRTSAHVNLLDALQACQVVASPAVQRLHLRTQDEGDSLLFASATTNGNGTATTDTATTSTSTTTTAPAAANLQSPDWKGLAAFLFGPKWQEENDEEEPPEEMQGVGGKRGPSATGGARKADGWEAPYLDEVPPFPQASEACANPHPLPPHVGLSLHRDRADEEDDTGAVDETELENIPDGVFTGSWGSVNKRKYNLNRQTLSFSDNNKVNGKDDDNDDKMGDATMADAASSSPPTKKVKIDDGTARDKRNDKDEPNEDEEQEQTNTTTTNQPSRSHANVPSFYPPPPPSTKRSTTEGRTVVDLATPAPRVEATLQEEQEGALAVRSSLVQLGNNSSSSYWGSGWESNAKSSATSNKSALAVPLGRSDGGDPSALVVPLGRASGSRVSRILEGSMDAAAMQ
jgi:hypothetical protein